MQEVVDLTSNANDVQNHRTTPDEIVNDSFVFRICSKFWQIAQEFYLINLLGGSNSSGPNPAYVTNPNAFTLPVLTGRSDFMFERAQLGLHSNMAVHQGGNWSNDAALMTIIENVIALSQVPGLSVLYSSSCYTKKGHILESSLLPCFQLHSADFPLFAPQKPSPIPRIVFSLVNLGGCHWGLLVFFSQCPDRLFYYDSIVLPGKAHVVPYSVQTFVEKLNRYEDFPKDTTETGVLAYPPIFTWSRTAVPIQRVRIPDQEDSWICGYSCLTVINFIKDRAVEGCFEPPTEDEINAVLSQEMYERMHRASCHSNYWNAFAYLTLTNSSKSKHADTYNSKMPQNLYHEDLFEDSFDFFPWKKKHLLSLARQKTVSVEILGYVLKRMFVGNTMEFVPRKFRVCDCTQLHLWSLSGEMEDELLVAFDSVKNSTVLYLAWDGKIYVYDFAKAFLPQFTTAHYVKVVIPQAVMEQLFDGESPWVKYGTSVACLIMAYNSILEGHPSNRFESLELVALQVQRRLKRKAGFFANSLRLMEQLLISDLVKFRFSCFELNLFTSVPRSPCIMSLRNDGFLFDDAVYCKRGSSSCLAVNAENFLLLLKQKDDPSYVLQHDRETYPRTVSDPVGFFNFLDSSSLNRSTPLRLYGSFDQQEFFDLKAKDDKFIFQYSPVYMPFFTGSRDWHSPSLWSKIAPLTVWKKKYFQGFNRKTSFISLRNLFVQELCFCCKNYSVSAKRLLELLVFTPHRFSLAVHPGCSTAIDLIQTMGYSDAVEFVYRRILQPLSVHSDNLDYLVDYVVKNIILYPFIFQLWPTLVGNQALSCCDIQDLFLKKKLRSTVNDNTVWLAKLFDCSLENSVKDWRFMNFGFSQQLLFITVPLIRYNWDRNDPLSILRFLQDYLVYLIRRFICTFSIPMAPPAFPDVSIAFSIESTQVDWSRLDPMEALKIQFERLSTSVNRSNCRSHPCICIPELDFDLIMKPVNLASEAVSDSCILCNFFGI